MKRLKKILHSKIFYILFLLFLFCYLFFSYQFVNSKYSSKDQIFTGTILSKKINENSAILEIKAKEKLLVYYNFSSIEFVNKLKIGDVIQVKGILEVPNRNSNFHLFNYQEYLKGKQIYWILKTENIILKESSKGLYLWKDKLIRRLAKRKNASYYFAFLLGDSSKLKFKKLYQDLGISHLFAVSGMHILFIATILSKLFQKIFHKEIHSFLCTSFILTFYVWLLSDSASANRAYFLYILSFLNKYYKWEFSSLKLLYFVAFISLFRNPFCFLQIGFQFSFIICFFLMLQKNTSKGYLKSLFETSFLAFLVSIPLSIYHFNQIHLGTILFNMVAVPIVTIVLFPLAFLSFLLEPLEVCFTFLIFLFETLMQIFQVFNFLKLTFKTVSILYIVFYYGILILALKCSKKWLLLFLLLLNIHFSLPYLCTHYWIDMIDIGQGDAILIRYPHLKETILIDCGGILPYGTQQTSKAETVLIPYFNALGIKIIDTFIITHGDFDHMGEAINLIRDFKIKKVIFNVGEYNELELELIKVLKEKRIPYYQNIKSLKMGKEIIYFLNTKDYHNENENSSVIYTKIGNQKLLLMGDAGIGKEKDILNKYDLQDIDILKVGHHGSSTSSSKEFINEIAPKTCLISVGKNNHYGHPTESVLNVLNECDIYRTDIHGGIEIKLGKKQYKIRTVS